MSDSNLIIQFNNFNPHTFDLDKNGHDLEKGGNSVSNWPGENAQLVDDGGATCKITQNLSLVSVGPCTFWCCWNDGVNRFGVKIHSNTQVLDIGDRPEWYVMHDQNIDGSSGNISWVKSGDDPANSYTWSESIGYNIVAVPTSSHQALDIVVTIQSAS